MAWNRHSVEILPTLDAEQPALAVERAHDGTGARLQLFAVDVQHRGPVTPGVSIRRARQYRFEASGHELLGQEPELAVDHDGEGRLVSDVDLQAA